MRKMADQKETKGISRRQILKYSAAAAAVVGVAAAGAGYFYGSSLPTSKPATTAKGGVYGGTLRVRIQQDPVGLDPHLAQDFQSGQIAENCYDKLVRYDYDYAFEPRLATSWETPSNTTYVFHLRKGVTFHDGNPFTANDVKYSLERIMNPATASPSAVNLEPVKSVSVVDDYTVNVELKAPFAPFLGKLAGYGCEIVSQKAVEKYGDLKHNPVGTGPYKYVEWLEGDHLKYERFSNYWRPGLPLLDALVFKPILDDAVALQSLSSGEIDLDFGAPFPEMARIRSEGKLVLNIAPGMTSQSIWINTTKPPLNDKHVRQALAYSLNVKQMVDSIYFGGAAWNNQPMPLDSPWRVTDLPWYNRDINKAKQLLADAGLSQGTSFTLTLPPFTQLRDHGLIAKDQAKEAGFDISTESLEWGVFVDRVLTKKDYQAAVCGWTTGVDPDDWMYNMFYTGAAWNCVNYSNSQVDTLLDQGRAELDPSKRKEIYGNAMKILGDEVPYVWMVTVDSPYAWSRQIKGFTPLASGWLRLEETWLSSE